MKKTLFISGILTLLSLNTYAVGDPTPAYYLATFTNKSDQDVIFVLSSENNMILCDNTACDGSGSLEVGSKSSQSPTLAVTDETAAATATYTIENDDNMPQSYGTFTVNYTPATSSDQSPTLEMTDDDSNTVGIRATSNGTNCIGNPATAGSIAVTIHNKAGLSSILK